MARARHYKRVAIIGDACAALAGTALALTTLPLWALLTLLSVFALGLGTTFPVTVVSTQNAVARSQVGTVTGALNFFRALMASFTVAAFTAILLMALGADISLAGEHRGPVNSIAGSRHDRGLPLCVRRSRGDARLRGAVHDPDGREAAGRPRPRRWRWRSRARFGGSAHTIARPRFDLTAPQQVIMDQVRQEPP
jgi:hypothetical protein